MFSSLAAGFHFGFWHKIQIPVFISGLKKKKKEVFLSNCEFLEKEVITRVATFEGEHILKNRAP